MITRRVNQLSKHEMSLEFLFRAGDSAGSSKTDLLLCRFLTGKEGPGTVRRPSGFQARTAPRFLSQDFPGCKWLKPNLNCKEKNVLSRHQSPGRGGDQPGVQSDWNHGLNSHQNKVTAQAGPWVWKASLPLVSLLPIIQVPPVTSLGEPPPPPTPLPDCMTQNPGWSSQEDFGANEKKVTLLGRQCQCVKKRGLFLWANAVSHQPSWLGEQIVKWGFSSLALSAVLRRAVRKLYNCKSSWVRSPVVCSQKIVYLFFLLLVKRAVLSCWHDFFKSLSKAIFTAGWRPSI